ncbi:zinc-dependent peptidase [Marichromatium gracile]|uniref:M90 family metallopeptidase n=1 Tax=Marichromatium gracile TaxID=1048 RepID=UPI001F2F6C10|nr:M90 family metallopeptidase [Marichromatium gracile]MCF1184128.1 zinc-dependent peptidase [Marichromatium gracile]
MGALSQWWRARRIERVSRMFSTRDWESAWEALPLLAGFDPETAERLEALALEFLRTKRIECAQGVALTATERLRIALQAALPVLELGLDWYRGWYAVIVYPEEFVPEREVMDDDGVVWIEQEAKSGESWEQGPVILSWADVAAGGRGEGYNVVIHELAHKLDMRAGAPNGCPPLHPGMSSADWQRDLAAAYADLCTRVEADEETAIDPYASESPAEFFAVTSEYFFEWPELLMETYPAVYAQLRAFYRQHPLARLAADA